MSVNKKNDKSEQKIESESALGGNRARAAHAPQNVCVRE